MTIQENIFEAIDKLIESKIQTVSFDKTIVAEIMDDSKANENKYYVKSDSDKFYAWSSGLKYTKGTRVYITIPQGDYSQKKLILGVYNSEKYEEDILINPTKRIIDISGNLITEQNLEQFKIAISAEKTHKLISAKLEDLVDYDIGSPVEFLGISMDINTQGIENAVRGNYGIIISGPENLPSYVFDCSQYLGDPYNYFLGFHQEMLFDISNIKSLDGYNVYLYQQGNFYDYNNTLITSGAVEIQNLKIFYGPSTSNYVASADKKQFIIYSNSGEGYEEDSTISIGSRWIREVEGEPGLYETIENGNGAESNVTYDLYCYKVGCEDVGAGPHWAKILNNSEKPWKFESTIPTEIQVSLNGETELINCPDINIYGGSEKFKAIINKTIQLTDIDCVNASVKSGLTVSFSLGNTHIIPGTITLIQQNDTNIIFSEKDKTIQFEDYDPVDIYINYEKGIIKTNNSGMFVPKLSEDKQYDLKFKYSYNSIKDLTSNTLEFMAVGENIGESKESDILLTFPSGDKYQGVYQVYGYDQRLINISLERETFNLIASAADNKKVLDPSAVEWRIPVNATMIQAPSGENWEVIEVNEVPYYSNKTLGNILTYNIKDIYSRNALNNTITCVVGEKVATKDLSFRMMGTSGTDYVLAIDMYKVDAEDNFTEEKVSGLYYNTTEKRVGLRATLYAADGFDITEKYKDKIRWNLSSPDWSSYYKISFSKENGEDDTSNASGQEVILYYKTDSGELEKNYIPHFITATLPDWTMSNGFSTTLQTSIPLAIIKEGYEYFDAPSRIIYDNEGKNSFLKEQILSMVSTLDGTSFTYALVGDGELRGIETQDGKVEYKYVPPSNISVYPAPTYIKVYDNNEPVWYQPILFEKNPYESKLLNNWPGTLKVDEDSNYILTNLIGAGSKDKNNRFSGVMMGSVGKTFDTATFGLYGYKAGTNRFKLDINGNFYVGNGDGSHIQLNDNGNFDISVKEFTLETEDKLLYLSNIPKDNFLVSLGKTDGKRLTVDKEGNLDVVGITADSIEVYDGTEANALLFKAADTEVEIAGWSVTANQITKSSTESTGRLPDEYTEVEWIESDGLTAYIDLEFQPTETTGFEITFTPYNDSASFGSIMGARETSLTKELQLTTYNDKTDYNGTLRFGNTSCNARLIKDGKITCSLRNGKYTDSYGSETALTGSFTSPCNLTVCALNNNGTPTQYGQVKIFSLQLYDGDTLNKNLVPAYKNSDNKIGLYDLLNKKFYPGTGIFTKGKDVPTTKIYTTTLDSKAGSITSNNINAQMGTIATWKLGSFTDNDATYSNSLYNDIGNYRVFLRSSGSNTSVAFGVKKYTDVNKTRSDYQFYVQNDGKLFAKNADIEGKITATSGSFTGHITATSGTFTGTITAGSNLSNNIDIGADAPVDNQCGRIRPWKDSNGKTTGFYLGYGKSSVNNLNSYISFNIDDLCLHHHGSQLSIDNNGQVNFLVKTGQKGYLSGTWYCGGALINGSDRNIKNTINPISEIYEGIFDNLSAVTYKYNDGTSNRLHTGFIAQEVEDAVINSGLTTKEFAAVCYSTDENGNKSNYGVRYAEIVSLNTWQIQKLKARVAELEAKLASK